MLYYGSPDFGTASGNGPPESSAIPRPSGPSSWTTGTNFAVTAAGLGNFTGDAYDDIVIGDFRESSTQHDGGRAAVYYGRSDRPAEITSYDRHVRGLQADERAGRTLGTPGDVDADGLNDLLLGAPRHDIGGDSERGTVRLYPGTDGALSLADSYEGSAVTAGGSTYAAGEERFGFGLGRGW
jgi:hypothetical protein